jgi:hypothetical protein
MSKKIGMMGALTFNMALLLLAGRTLAQAQDITDITVNNGQGTSPSNYALIAPTTYGAEADGDFNTNPDTRYANGVAVQALGYVNYNCVPDKSWDLEAFGYNANTGVTNGATLTYVGGFNPLTTNEGYSLGDIFLSTSAVTGPTGIPSSDGAVPYTNPGYQYAIHITSISGTTLNYSIYQLSGSTQLTSVYFAQNSDSNPYALANYTSANGVNDVYDGTATVSADSNGQVDTLLHEGLFYGATADSGETDNYVATFTIGSLDLSGFDAYLTEQCGNDELSGSTFSTTTVVTTPEPASVWLGVVALLAIFAVRRAQTARR